MTGVKMEACLSFGRNRISSLGGYQYEELAANPLLGRRHFFGYPLCSPFFFRYLVNFSLVKT